MKLSNQGMKLVEEMTEMTNKGLNLCKIVTEQITDDRLYQCKEILTILGFFEQFNQLTENGFFNQFPLKDYIYTNQDTLLNDCEKIYNDVEHFNTKFISIRDNNEILFNEVYNYLNEYTEENMVSIDTDIFY